MFMQAEWQQLYNYEDSSTDDEAEGERSLFWCLPSTSRPMYKPVLRAYRRARNRLDYVQRLQAQGVVVVTTDEAAPREWKLCDQALAAESAASTKGPALSESSLHEARRKGACMELPPVYTPRAACDALAGLLSDLRVPAWQPPLQAMLYAREGEAQRVASPMTDSGAQAGGLLGRSATWMKSALSMQEVLEQADEAGLRPLSPGSPAGSGGLDGERATNNRGGGRQAGRSSGLRVQSSPASGTAACLVLGLDGCDTPRSVTPRATGSQKSFDGAAQLSVDNSSTRDGVLAVSEASAPERSDLALPQGRSEARPAAVAALPDCWNSRTSTGRQPSEHSGDGRSAGDSGVAARMGSTRGHDGGGASDWVKQDESEQESGCQRSSADAFQDCCAPHSRGSVLSSSSEQRGQGACRLRAAQRSGSQCVSCQLWVRFPDRFDGRYNCRRHAASHHRPGSVDAYAMAAWTVA